MLWTNVKILLVVLGTLGTFTVVANSIPQVESDVPEELTFSGEVTAAELVTAGEELYDGAGACTSCHGLGTRAPNLLTDEGGTGTIGVRCGNRVPGEDCKTYLHRSMIEPHAYVVEGYPPIMPDQSRTLSPAQIWALVAYLQDQGGEVTVTGADIEASGGGSPGAPAGGGGAAGAPPAAGGPVTASTDPGEILQANNCTVCHSLSGPSPIGPSFEGMGSRLSADQIRAGILDPAATAAAGYEQFLGTMPTNFGEALTARQLEAVVAFLVAQR